MSTTDYSYAVEGCCFVLGRRYVSIVARNLSRADADALAARYADRADTTASVLPELAGFVALATPIDSTTSQPLHS